MDYKNLLKFSRMYSGEVFIKICGDGSGQIQDSSGKIDFKFDCLEELMNHLDPNEPTKEESEFSNGKK